MPRAISIGMVSFIVCLGLLFIFYPWSTYYQNFNYGAGITFISYLLLASLVGFIVTVVVGIMSFYTKMPALGQCVMTGVVSLTSLSAGAFLMGPVGIEIFDTRVRGIFFSEWQFLNFICTIALPISILGAGLVWLAIQRGETKKG
jgi:hypothetical protein